MAWFQGVASVNVENPEMSAHDRIAGAVAAIRANRFVTEAVHEPVEDADNPDGVLVSFTAYAADDWTKRDVADAIERIGSWCRPGMGDATVHAIDAADGNEIEATEPPALVGGPVDYDMVGDNVWIGVGAISVNIVRLSDGTVQVSLYENGNEADRDALDSCSAHPSEL